MISLKRKIDLVFFILLAVLSLIFYLTFRRSQFAKESEYRVSHTHQVLYNLERVLINTVDMETNQRGYMLTGSSMYLAPIEKAYETNKGDLENLRRLIADNPSQTKRLDTLTALINGGYESLHEGITIRSGKGAEAAAAFVMSHAGRTIMNNVRSLSDRMKKEELLLLAKRSDIRDNRTKEVSGLYLLFSVFMLLLIFAFYFYIRRSTSKLSVLNDEMGNKNEELNSINEDMKSTEEQLLANIDQINLLQKYLEDREKQYRELFENVNDIIYELDENGKLQLFNPSMESVSGYEAGELKDMLYLDLVHDSYKSRVLEFYQKQIKAQQVASYLELPMVTKAGEKIWIGQSVRMIFSEKGWVQKVIVVARNISELKAIQRKLKQSEKRYRLISENSHDFIALNKTTGEYTFVSNAVKDLLDYDPEELIGRKDVELIHPDDGEKIKLLYEEVLAGKSVFNVQYRMQKKFGGYVWMESNAKPIFNSEHQLTDVQTSARNITYRKKVEEELIKAKEDAEELTKAKSLFLSMMSHEIRTPMNAIIGLTNLLMQEAPRPDQQESLKLLKFSGDNLLTIINDILDFSKIEAGKIELENIDFNLFDLLANIKLMLQQRANDKGIALYLKFDERAPKIVKGDQVRIGQIVTNLVSNAIKFTEQGYVELSVQWQGNKEGKHELVFKTKDTGIGIENDKLNLIFEGFSQARTDTTRKFGGTGLGLSISKRLLNLMESEIRVDSAVGEGSVFSFTLLLEEGKISVKDNTSTGVTKGEVNFNINVLLVDDNRVNQIVAANFLKKWGVKVDVADNGKSSLEMVKTKSYQLILMDLQMPIMDGYEASREIRSWSEEYFKNVPIIALTAEAMTEIKEQAFAAGMNDFITKPFQPDELQGKIFQHINVKLNQPDKFSRLDKIQLYAEGDPEFRRELASTIVKNLTELKSSLNESIKLGSGKVYFDTLSKVRATIHMLGDTQLMTSIENLRQHLAAPTTNKNGMNEAARDFNLICNEVIEGLHEENHTI